MRWIRAAYGDEEAAIMAVQAGNDINGQISETQFDQSLIRILKWKVKLNLLPLK